MGTNFNQAVLYFHRIFYLTVIFLNFDHLGPHEPFEERKVEALGGEGVVLT